MKCSICSHPLRRAHRTQFTHYLLSLVGIYPWVCSHCNKSVRRVCAEQAALAGAAGILFLSILVGGIGFWRARNNRVAELVSSQSTPFVPRTADVPQASAQRPAGPGIYIANVIANEDIVQMSQAKLGGDVIIQVIRNSAHNFHVDPRSLIQLKREGAPDDVIRVMIDVSAAYTSPAPAQGGLTASPAVWVAP